MKQGSADKTAIPHQYKKQGFKSLCKQGVCICLLVLAGVLISGAGGAGSADDPLVTKSWVDAYVFDATKDTAARIDNLSVKLGGKRVIQLWVNKKTTKIDGVAGTIDVPPIIKDGRTMLPFRYLGEALGAKVDWDNANKKVIYTKGKVTLAMNIGKKEIRQNGVAQPLDVAPILQEGRTLVPLRVISDKLGAKVDWDNTAKQVTITYSLESAGE